MVLKHRILRRQIEPEISQFPRLSKFKANRVKIFMLYLFLILICSLPWIQKYFSWHIKLLDFVLVGFIGTIILLHFYNLLSTASAACKITSNSVPKSLPFVSIVIPIFNQRDEVFRTLISLLKLDYPAYEIIIVNNYTGEKTKDFCRKYVGVRKGKYNPVKVSLINNPACNLICSLKIGARFSKGEVILLMDQDSILKENSLTNSVQNFIDNSADAALGNRGIEVFDLLSAGMGEQLNYANFALLKKSVIARLNFGTDIFSVFKNEEVKVMFIGSKFAPLSGSRDTFYESLINAYHSSRLAFIAFLADVNLKHLTEHRLIIVDHLIKPLIFASGLIIFSIYGLQQNDFSGLVLFLISFFIIDVLNIFPFLLENHENKKKIKLFYYAPLKILAKPFLLMIEFLSIVEMLIRNNKSICDELFYLNYNKLRV